MSAVTFITAVQVLEGRGIEAGGHMAAAMALMESPAIILAVLMANVLRTRGATILSGGHSAGGGTLVMSEYTPNVSGRAALPLGKVLHESFTDGAQLLLLGAMAVGMVSGEAGQAAMKPFTGDLFKGLLAFFLLDMGLTTARHFSALKGLPAALAVWGLAAPMAHAGLAMLMARALDLSVGDGALLMVLAASASYIAVPAVLRQALPEAKPALYFGLSLGVTFPFNILLGIPLYLQAAQWALG